jgi:hypothetical protein
MAKRLLDRQVSLLAYLTSRTAIFGEDGDASLDRSLRGMDRDMLRLEARFSYRKRMEKIAAAFPRTFELLGSDQDAIEREFVESCPPVDISRLVNARQFHEFLCARWQREPPDPPFLRDVAACELACAQVRVEGEGREMGSGRSNARRRRIRRCPGVVLLRCGYDVRPIFEAGVDDGTPIERDTPIVIAMPPGAEQPLVSELPPAIFDLLAALDDWTDPAELGATSELNEVIRELSEHRLIEVAKSDRAVRSSK